MKALRFNEFGTPDVLKLENIPTPGIGADEALIKVMAASVNPSDLGNVNGHFPYTTLPRTPGRDYAGIVEQGPSSWLGAEVWSTGNLGFTRDGSHAEYIVVPSKSLRKKPKNLNFDQAASIGVTFVTAWLGVSTYAQLQKGETLVVIGASGGVGGAAVQIGKFLGARVIGIARSEIDPNAPVHKAADKIIIANADSYNDVIRKETNGEGAQVILNTVGRDTFEPSLQALTHRGRLAILASPGMRKQSFDFVDFYHNESQLFGVDSLKQDLVASADILEALTPGFESGQFSPPLIAKRFSLEEGIDAYNATTQSPQGRIVIAPHDMA